MAHPHDSEDVAEVLRGNQDAYEVLVQRYSGSLSALAYDRLGNVADAQDVVQEAFVVAYKKLSTLRDTSRFGPWIYEIVRNLCATKLRDRGIHRRGMEVLAEQRAGSVEFTPLDHAEHDERQEKIRKAVESLSPVLREAVVLRYLGGSSRQEAAGILDISLDALDKRMERALKELRSKLL